MPRLAYYYTTDSPDFGVHIPEQSKHIIRLFRKFFMFPTVGCIAALGEATKMNTAP